MNVTFSSIRWPVEIYEKLKEKAYERRMSVNKLVVEIVRQALAATT